MNENNTAAPKCTKSQALSRKWVTPFTLGAFALSAVTGILLFFKMHIGLIKPAHEWLSWFLVIAAVFHIYLNYRPLLKTVTQPLGKALMALFVLLIGASFLPFGDHGQNGRNHDDHAVYNGEEHRHWDH